MVKLVLSLQKRILRKNKLSYGIILNIKNYIYNRDSSCALCSC